MLGVSCLIYYFLIPVLAKRKDYIGSGPKVQVASINSYPFIVFVVICLVVAGYGWLNGI